VAPQLVGSEIEVAYRSAVAERRRITFDARSPVSGRWFEIQLDPTSRAPRLLPRHLDTARGGGGAS
jgi:hypothetical protein